MFILNLLIHHIKSISLTYYLTDNKPYDYTKVMVTSWL